MPDSRRAVLMHFQYATPGTVSQWYCDGLMEGASPVGPFREAEYAPVSLKVGGFIGGAGHCSVFQDKHSNWWRVTTMWIGALDLFERRIGLFPVRFDEEDRMLTETAFGDYPIVLPPGSAADSFGSLGAGWWLLSFGKPCTGSSTLPGHAPESASDESSLGGPAYFAPGCSAQNAPPPSTACAAL